MKSKFWIFLVVLILMTMTACGNDKPISGDEAEVPQPIVVDLTVTEKVEVNGTVEMAAVVTQGDEKVEDADKVEFEIWEEGKKDDSVKIESTNEKDGLYTAETTFDHDGLFHVQVHVTARGLHTMPKKEVTVGSGVQSVEARDGEEDGESVEGFKMNFVAPENVKAGEDTNLVVHIQVDGTPLEKVRVRYEIWNVANADKRDWIEVAEPKAGEYASAHAFKEAGTFKVQIHVEDEKELHEHEEYTIEVK